MPVVIELLGLNRGRQPKADVAARRLLAGELEAGLCKGSTAGKTERGADPAPLS
jgi:hypothetical protein